MTSTTPAQADLKLEAIVIPVSDVDRSKKFYQDLGWRLDADFAFDNGFRVVQVTPPGSPASIQFGTRITNQRPGTAEGIYLVVSDIAAARDQLAALGADVGGVFHPEAPGAQFGRVPDGQAGGPATDRASYGSFATFRDLDGNAYLIQEVTHRLPGRVDSTVTEYASVNDLVGALRRAAAAHGEHEARNGGAFDENWPDWYAAYMVAEHHGDDLPK
ncbi:VOC family protein [Nonomuraea endophytica]|uniref:Catechol 2,3-dioxygenase-like lactoylglutathione lyase family enzyme n=1 Tax=Nonomuraea endophytica TaxID=714136 RepID=A0A7W8AEH9_9ACTN|nr:VOC family protein [Nonomuraea endophytica]MBB5083705.1 catechol 2,3-dioxygenase-like lactoylglutathione lyase family enzyme [Nonomuraea endophytica]